MYAESTVRICKLGSCDKVRAPLRCRDDISRRWQQFARVRNIHVKTRLSPSRKGIGMDSPDLPVLMMMGNESPKNYGCQIASEHRSEITVILDK